MNKVKPIYFLFALAAFLSLIAGRTEAQEAMFGKMSPLVRQAARENIEMFKAKDRDNLSKSSNKICTAFVRFEGDPREVADQYDCTVLASFGDLAIVEIPLSSIAPLSLDGRVRRIEAGRRAKTLMDTVVVCSNIQPVYDAESPLDQAFTGKGVLVGCMDVGIDFTHPNFYSPDMSEYRVRRYWDQLSTDTIGSRMNVGRDYTSEEEILALGHSTDASLTSHGTHTTGTAAGGGYVSPYRGVAYEADICLVSNVLSDNVELIDSADYYKYTTATDALGLKYIFDYAEEIGEPCVINLSQGMYEDLAGESKLYEDFVDSLSGPGRIIVCAAGNEGDYTQYFHKEKGTESMGAIAYNAGNDLYAIMRCNNAVPFEIRISINKVSDNIVVESDTVSFDSDLALLAEDSVYYDYISTSQGDCGVGIAGYSSCYDDGSEAYELLLYDITIPSSVYIVVEIVGEEADVEYILQKGTILECRFNSQVSSGEQGHNLFAPSTARQAICVGASAYRPGITLLSGTYYSNDKGTDGTRSSFSSMGPTIDGRIKPDVMAPGVNVISSYSSFWTETPDKTQVAVTEYEGTEYSWNADSGTSMAAPVVTGILALWLEADPTLSPDDIKEVFGRTCSQPVDSLEYPNTIYGYGNIDAYAGLLDILGLSSGIAQIPAEKTSASIRVDGDYLYIYFPEEAFSDRNLTINIYSTDGKMLINQEVRPSSEPCRIGISGLPSAVYAVKISGSSAVGGSALFRK